MSSKEQLHDRLSLGDRRHSLVAATRLALRGFDESQPAIAYRPALEIPVPESDPRPFHPQTAPNLVGAVAIAG